MFQISLAAGFAARADAASVTYAIEDVLPSAGYQDFDTTQTFTGIGFVGEYSDSFAHFVGLEGPAFSRTDLQVGIGALAGASISSATLSFVLLNGPSNTATLTATSYDSGGTLAYNFFNTQTSLGTASGTVTGLSANSLDVTALLQGAVTGGQSYFALHLETDVPSLWTYTHSGYDYTADSAQVRLTVEYTAAAVPEPASRAA